MRRILRATALLNACCFPRWFRHGMGWALLIVALATLLPNRIRAQEPLPSDSLVSVVLKDGTTLRGTIVAQDDTIVLFLTIGGAEVRMPRSSIVSIRPIRGRVVDGVFQRFDPNYSRLLFAPTGRPLRKGDSYFSDFYVFLPGVAYGITDHFSLMAGMSIIPGISLTSQLFYIAPRLGWRQSEHLAVSVGALYASVLEEDVSAGIAFAVGTFGEEDASFTAGLGLGYTKGEGTDFEFADHPIIMLGGNVRISNGLAFVTENWLIAGDNFDLGEQPFTVALRFFGEHIAVDAGLITHRRTVGRRIPDPVAVVCVQFWEQLMGREKTAHCCGLNVGFRCQVSGVRCRTPSTGSPKPAPEGISSGSGYPAT